MKTELYTIKALTNLHVGSGEINFDIIDNQVQRDEYNLPTIHSSSLKGALREHMDANTRGCNYIFGPSADDNSSSQQTGAYSFFEASLLTRPARSNKKPYFNATSTAVLSDFLERAEDFDIEIDTEIHTQLKALCALTPSKGEAIIFESLTDVKIEHLTTRVDATDVSKLADLLGENIVLLHKDDLENMALPVLARNYLVNGESKNLWYEEVVPKRSKFYFILGKPTNIDERDANDIRKLDNQFDEALTQNVQIGANASIGYGYTKIVKVAS